MCFLVARTLPTIGSARAHASCVGVCVCGGGGNFMTGAAFNMNGGGCRPPQGYARSATGTIMYVCVCVFVCVCVYDWLSYLTSVGRAKLIVMHVMSCTCTLGTSSDTYIMGKLPYTL